MSLDGPVRFGEYLLLRKIAAGGMAEIYEGELQGIGGFRRKVAIKRILPQFCDDETFVKMLLDEARIAARLTHPNIVQVVNCGAIEGSYFIAMEFVDGHALSRVLKRLAKEERGLTIDQSIFVTVGLLRALDFAHKAVDDTGKPMRVVHRDVSPQNVLVNYGGEVKLVDFGVAHASDKMSKTETGAVKGKLAYMAPEQLAGTDIDHRLDQYAAALVLFECICGVRAYSGRSEVDVIQRVLASDIENLDGRLEASSASPSLVAALKRALARERDERFADCAAFADALMAELDDTDLTRLAGQVARLMADHVPRDEITDPRGSSAGIGGEPTKKLTTSGRSYVDLTGSPTTPVKMPHASLLDDGGPELPSAPARDDGAARGASHGRLLAATLVVVVAIVATAAVLIAGRRAAAPDPAEPSGQPALATTEPAAPSSDVPSPSAASPDVPPLAVAPAPAPAPNVVVEPPAPVDEPKARAHTRTAAKKPSAAAPATASTGGAGTLDVACLPWCEITIDGKATGKTSPLREYSLPAGEHVVEVLNPPSGQSAKQVVKVRGGEAARLNFRLQ